MNWLKILKKLNISSVVFSNMAAGKRTSQMENVGKSYVKGCLVSREHKNINPTVIPMSELNFSMTITSMSPSHQK